MIGCKVIHLKPVDVALKSHLFQHHWNGFSLLAFFCLFFFIFTGPANAGGPLSVENGKPVRWRLGSTVSYSVDQGRLGPLSNSAATQLVVDAFRAWSQGTNAWITFDKNSRLLPEDYTGTNYSRLDIMTNAIIFDDDGSIINLLYGNGARNDYLGFASPYMSGNNIVSARAVFNGYFFQRKNMNMDEIYSTILHEIGHFCGLDHTQQCRHLAYNGMKDDDIYVPIMFPTTTDDESKRTKLTFDDELAIMNLYPTNFHLNSRGNIQGTVKRNSEALNGVNVIAYDRADPLGKITSTVTGTFKRGEFLFQGLPPGEYLLKVEAIDRSFVGASSVGQYANRSSDESFSKSQVKSEFYNTDDQTDEGRSITSSIKVENLKTITNIHFQVERESITNNEARTVVLPLHSFAYGGTKANSNPYYDFLLHPSGEEKRLDLLFHFNPAGEYVIRLQADLGRGTQGFSYNTNGNEHTIHIAEFGHIPLQATQYYLYVENPSSSDVQYEIHAVQSDEALATPTPSPTTTPTVTLTPTPSATFTHTPTNTPTFTQTPTMTPFPTKSPAQGENPSSISGDLNQDGVVDAKDVFFFATQWNRPRSDAQIELATSPLITEKIHHQDLLLLIEAIRKRSDQGKMGKFSPLE